MTRTVPAKFAEGELVNVQIHNARVVSVGDPNVLPTAIVQVENQFGEWRFEVPTAYPGVDIERVAPAEWPPRAGDIWEDGKGNEWSAVVWDGDVKLYEVDRDAGTREWPDSVANKVGPMCLVRRRGWTPAAPAEVGESENRAYRELTEAERRAETIAGLRELADVLEARPDIYFDHQISFSTTYEPDPVVQVEKWAQMLGVTAVHEPVKDTVHHRAIGKLHGLSLFVVHIEKPAEPVEPEQPTIDEAPAEPELVDEGGDGPIVGCECEDCDDLTTDAAPLPHRVPDADAQAVLAETLDGEVPA